jgi:hypothetical protein
MGVTFQANLLASFVLRPDTTWWCNKQILYLDTWKRLEPENILIGVTFQEKIFGIICFGT